MAQQKVLLEGMLLKPSMLLSPEVQRTSVPTPEEVAEKTIDCFKRVLPASVPGVVFLSGGEPDVSVTSNLNALNPSEQTMLEPLGSSASVLEGVSKERPFRLGRLVRKGGECRSCCCCILHPGTGLVTHQCGSAGHLRPRSGIIGNIGLGNLMWARPTARNPSTYSGQLTMRRDSSSN